MNGVKMENIELIPSCFGYGESENGGMIPKVILGQKFPENILHPCIYQIKRFFVSTCIYPLLRLL